MANSRQGQPTSSEGERAAVIRPGPLYFRLLLPVTRIGWGVFSVDPLEQLLGCPLESLLSAVMVGPVEVRASADGVGVRAFPMGLPVGDGAGLKLGGFGELSLYNDQGYLRLAVPAIASGWLLQRLEPWLVQGPVGAMSEDGRSMLAVVWIRLVSGMRAVVPIPGVGEVGVEAT